MEHTFMTIHNLTPDANILFASDSITDILGYQPYEVQDKSCFEYFHPDEVPFARHIHNRGVLLDKAAVLHYARILSRDGRWISCECCFTVVHDVLVACISIYRRSERSDRRALEAPQIRRLFSCSPKDPRYHMLEHLSPKFQMPTMEREPRAALILNRFSRSLGIMFATNAVASILGLDPEQILNKSFYECIQEACLGNAVKCIESAKANDSIAYLRFWSRDPRHSEDLEQPDHQAEEDEDIEGTEEDIVKEEEDDNDDKNMMYWDESREAQHGECASDLDDGGVPPTGKMDIDYGFEGDHRPKTGNDGFVGRSGSDPADSSATMSRPTSVAAPTPMNLTPASSMSTAARRPDQSHMDQTRSPRHLVASVELEAVVSCTSDGLVVVLRRARPEIPTSRRPALSTGHSGGLCAAPWSQLPVDSQYSADMLQFMPFGRNTKVAGGPPLDQLMRSIRDVAVFAWALVGINGNIAMHGRGHPAGESQPPNGLPVWDSHSKKTQYCGPVNQATRRRARRHGQGGPPGSTNHDRTPYPMAQTRGSTETQFASEHRRDWHPRARSARPWNASSRRGKE